MAGINPGLKESEIQTLILAWLLSRRLTVWRNQSQGTYDAAKGFYRAMNQVGARKGVPDILGVLPDGRFLAIEVKSATGRVSKDQDLFIAEVNTMGGLAFVARSLEDVKEHLSEYARAG